MLRVGLTGELGSGKSTVARMLAERGAIVFSSDEMGRAMMQPGEPVYAQIVERFGPAIVNEDGTLNRRALAKLAFDPPSPRIEELNAIVHPAVIAKQADMIAEIERTQPHAIVVVESALIFSSKHTLERNWRSRFDCVVQVTAPDELKIERFVQRTEAGAVTESVLREDAQRRLLAQRVPIPDDIPCIKIANDTSIPDLEQKVDTIWEKLILLEQNLATS